MTNWLHEQRLEAALAEVRERQPVSILDLGCGNGDLLVHMFHEPHVERIVGLDLCRESLARLRRRLDCLDRDWPKRIELVRGSITERHLALTGYDCAVLIETIEHLDPAVLGDLERTVFGAMRPGSVMITTPNAEFNPLLGVPPHRFRHPDHRFEWDRQRFRRWAQGVAARNNYVLACRDVAGHHPTLGGASQMAVFDVAKAPPAGSPHDIMTPGESSPK